MSKTKQNEKIQTQAEELLQAKTQIQVLTRQNQELKGALLDRNVNEVRRIESFRLLAQAWSNPAYVNAALKSIKRDKITLEKYIVSMVDSLITELLETAQGGDIETEPKS